MRWRSVTVPMMLPKPDVVALTGGYRRTPFMQIGADIYCDSALMCRVIDRLVAGAAALSGIHPRPGGDRRPVGRPVVLLDRGAVHDAAGRRRPHLRRRCRREAVKAFGADRAAMSPAFRRAPLHDQAAHFHDYLGRLEASARRRPAVPARRAALDRRRLGGAVDLVRAPRAAGRGASRRLPAHRRLVRAGHGVRPRHVRADDERRGDRAGEPDDHVRALRVDAGAGLAAGTTGRRRRRPTTRTTRSSAAWSASTRSEVVVERVDERAGTVHVHFPRVGFHVKAIRKDGP